MCSFIRTNCRFLRGPAHLSWLATLLLLLTLVSSPTVSKQTIHVVGEPSLTYYASDESTDSGYATGMDALFLTHLLEELGYKSFHMLEILVSTYFHNMRMI